MTSYSMKIASYVWMALSFIGAIILGTQANAVVKAITREGSFSWSFFFLALICSFVIFTILQFAASVLEHLEDAAKRELERTQEAKAEKLRAAREGKKIS